jgi:DNA-directed RNA polymerase alpha subunit
MEDEEARDRGRAFVPLTGEIVLIMRFDDGDVGVTLTGANGGRAATFLFKIGAAPDGVVRAELTAPGDVASPEPEPEQVETAVLNPVLVSELVLSDEVDAALARGGLATVRGLLTKTDEQLLQTPGIDERGLEEIDAALDLHGLDRPNFTYLLLDELDGVPVPARTALLREGVLTVAQLLSKTTEWLLDTRGVGPGRIRAIDAALWDLGLERRHTD